MKPRYLSVLLLMAASPAAADPWLDGCAAFRERAGISARQAGTALDVQAAIEHLEHGEAAGFAGTALISTGAGPLLARGFGWADRDGQRRLSPATVIDIGSVSKQFTAAAVLSLAERGLLDPADPIARFLPRVPPDKQAITIHHLLTHTSGIDRDLEPVRTAEDRDAAVAAALASSLADPPGAAYRYSNSGYVLLAAIIERASGQSYAAVLQALFDRAGLTQTGWSGPATPGFFAADGENISGVFATPDPEIWQGDGPNWGRRGPGALLSTPRDLVRWVSALRDGKVLSEASLAQMVFPHVREEGDEASFYGYGWALSSGADGACRIWHDGSNSRHFNILTVFPEAGTVTHVSSIAARSPVGRAVLRDFHPVLFGRRESALPPRGKVSPEEAARLAGRWVAEDGTSVQLVRRGDGIELATTAPAAARLFTGFAPLADADAERVARVRPELVGIIDAVATGHLDPLLAVLRRDVGKAEETAYWQGEIARWTRAYGPFRRSEIIATLRRGDQVLSYALLHFESGSVPLTVSYDERGDIFIGTNFGADPDTDLLPWRYVVARDPQSRLVVDNPLFPAPVEVELSADGSELHVTCPRGRETLRRADAAQREASA